MRLHTSGSAPRKSVFLPLALAFMTALCCGCATLNKPALNIRYYTLEYPQPSAGATSALPAVLRVERFHVAPEYDTDRMVYRESDFSRASYSYHKWRATPGELTAHFLRRDLAAAGIASAVIPEGSGVTPTHLLDGYVDEFLEWDLPQGGWEAKIGIHLTLLLAEEPDVSKRVLFQSRFQASSKCAQETPEALAAAMSEAMAAVSAQAIGAVRSALEPGKR